MEAVHNKEKTCSICIEPLANVKVSGSRYTVIKGGNIIGSDCAHLFHQACISRWLESQTTCPNCRNPGFRNHVVTFAGNDFALKYETSLNEGTQLRPTLVANPQEALPVRSAPVTATQLCAVIDLAIEGAPEGRVPAESKSAVARAADEKIRAQMRKEATDPFTDNEKRILKETVGRNESFLRGRTANSRLTTILGGLKTIRQGH